MGWRGRGRAWRGSSAAPALATAAAGISGEVGVDSGSARPGRLPRGPREVRGQLDSDRRKGRARSPSSPHGGWRRSNGGLVGVLAREEGNREAL
jgi:hypothetical protein